MVGETSKFYLSVTSAEFWERCRVIKQQKSGFWFVYCVAGLGRGPIRSVFCLVCFFTKICSVFGLNLDIFSMFFVQLGKKSLE